MNNHTALFRGFLGKNIAFSARLGWLLILLFGIPRFFLVLGANSGGTYSYISLIFLCMWATPFLLLTKKGRTLIGLHKPGRPLWWMFAPLLGIGMSLLVFFLGDWFYGNGISNWFVYISRSYEGMVPADSASHQFLIFAILATLGMTFSPIGEELLYRGLIHQCFVTRLGEPGASRVDSAAFAVTHLAHFGILYTAAGWEFRAIPALLWMGLMYLSCRLFFLCKVRGGSLYMAILCHAGFNLAMTYVIWFHIL